MSDPIQAVVSIERFGTPDGITVLRDQPIPEPGPGQVRVRIEATSVQFTDTMIRRGEYPDVRDPAPLTPGYDMVGRVDATGPGVTAFSVGDRVCDLTVIGANARFMLCEVSKLVRVPEGVDAAEATTLVLSWMTTYQILKRRLKVKSGDRVMVIGGNGSVGRATIGLARHFGIEVWVTASEKHHAILKEEGATVFPRSDWVQPMIAAGGVDAVIDGVAEDGFWSPFAVLRPGGTVVAIGMSAVLARGGGVLGMGGALVQLGFRHLWPNGGRAVFHSITSYRSKNPDHWSEDLAALLALLEKGEVSPTVAERLTLAQVEEAHRRLEAGGLTGKLVLEPWK